MDENPLTPEANSLYREVVLDRDLQQLRERFCRTTAESLESVAGWLAVDSFLGAGDLQDSAQPIRPSADRYAAFRATAAVIEMASELVSGAIQCLDQERRYAATALIRQLLEAEYLLTAFAIDFAEATRWASSTPDQIRRSFAVGAMRSIGRFSNAEYWRHCTMGGHPSPMGARLLRYNGLSAVADEDFMTATVWGDLAQHLRRLWGQVDSLLRQEHARYANVRRGNYEQVAKSEKAWVEADLLVEPIDIRIFNELANLMEQDQDPPE